MKGQYNTHHRKPRSKGGQNSKENTVVVSIAKHEAWHCLVGNAEPKEIARILTEWLDPEWRLIAIHR